MEKIFEKLAKIIKKMLKIYENSSKIEVRGVPEALGRGLGAILAPKGAPGTKGMQKGAG